MVNYPVRGCCFLAVGFLFFLPAFFLLVGYNRPLWEKQDNLYTITGCTLVDPIGECDDDEIVPGSKECVVFSLNRNDSGCLANNCNGSGLLRPLKRDNPLEINESTSCYYQDGDLKNTTEICELSTTEPVDEGCGTEADGVDVIEDVVINETAKLFVAPPGCFYRFDETASTGTPYVLVTGNLTVTTVCYSTGADLVERKDYGGLSLLVEGFFFTFTIICLIGVGLATFVEKTPNNDAYCFNIRL
eukprot:CAMPEP_0201478574 /NCGR_PEP_ID=MMETSP0151_2-20130828/3370_1 /ASSEMBLY_ACC=CAM_ASM_000257 /TAXON_ID=200890 /ORGANISM="Paramoeba atlantica, Strain 621/1 / CCAP 1560/9" /LENGTH=244 /DNA_ID=CAMNT_0047859681 /DNA_START=264 /DNA_END=998 /DNA_ORIENTATION=-